MIHTLFANFVHLWKSENSFSEILNTSVDLIVPISFVTKRTELTHGTQRNVERACAHAGRKRHARIAWSSCSYPFLGADAVETRFRLALLSSVAPDRIIVAEPMINTVDEAMKIKEKLRGKGIFPKTILLVTGELHSRSARYVWEKVFPEATILIDCIPCRCEIEPDHPVLSQRKMASWVRDNILRQIALRILPLGMVRRIQHKAAS